MEDRLHAHNMGIELKIFTSIKGCLYMSDKSLREESCVASKALPKISLVILGHVYEF